MEHLLLERIRALLRKGRRNKIWRRVTAVLAGVVVFATTYMLILPAITAEKPTLCGKEEHVHTEECYAQTDVARTLQCPYADPGEGVIVLHKHDENCYDENGNLICPLQEREEHAHTQECYQKVLVCTQEEGQAAETPLVDAFSDSSEEQFGSGETEGHTHTDACYETRLVCGKEELVPHIHGPQCYQETEDGKVLICDKPEVIVHQHTDECFVTTEPQKTLICGKEEHQHDESCYPQPTATPTPQPTLEPDENTELPSETTTEAETETETEEETESIPETETEMEAEMETETEAEIEETTEEETTQDSSEEDARTFTYEDDEMIVTAVLSDSSILPESVEFIVEPADLNQEEQNQVEEKVQADADSQTEETQEEPAETAGEKKTLVNYAAYDMRFELNGTEVEPQGGTVDICIQYKNGLSLQKEEDQDGTKGQYYVFHMKENGQSINAQDVSGDVEADEDDLVKEIRFTTDSFSKMVIALYEANGAETATTISGTIEWDDQGHEGQRPGSGVTIKLQKRTLTTFTGSGETTINTQSDWTDTNQTDVASSSNNWRYTLTYTPEENCEYRIIEAPNSDFHYAVKYISNERIKNIWIGTEDTFLNNTIGGFQRSYTLDCILNHYNIFAFGNVEANHTVGSVICQGNLTLNNTFGTGVQPENSLEAYIGGQLINTAPDNRIHTLYLGSSNRVELIAGDEVANGWVSVNDRQLNYGGYDVKITDQYINFTEARTQLKAQSEALFNDPYNETINPGNINTTDGNLYLDAGHRYYITPGTCAALESNRTAGKGGYIRLDTQISGSASQETGTVFNLGSQNNNTIELPEIQFKDSSGNWTTGLGDGGTDKGLSIVWNVPYASTVTYGGHKGNEVGHLVAVNADATISSGNYSGTMIVNNLTAGEGHMWPYNGQELIPASYGLSAKKTVNGNIPVSGESFTFELYKLASSGWTDIQSVQNNGSQIKFDNITYQQAGDYWYKITEEIPDTANSSGFTYSSDQYVARVTVIQETENNTTVNRISSITYYKVTDTDNLLSNGTINTSAIQELTEENNSGSLIPVFNNKKNVPAEVQFSGTKTITGITSTDRSFTFELYETDSNGTNSLVQSITTSGTISGSYMFNFGKIMYNEPGTHNYVIKEQIPEDQGEFVYDTTEYQVQVVVAYENKNSNALKATVTGTAGSAIENVEHNLNFINRYQEKTSVTVKKEWKDQNGNSISNPPSPIEVSLKRYALSVDELSALQENTSNVGTNETCDLNITLTNRSSNPVMSLNKTIQVPRNVEIQLVFSKGTIDWIGQPFNIKLNDSLLGDGHSNWYTNTSYISIASFKLNQQANLTCDTEWHNNGNVSQDVFNNSWNFSYVTKNGGNGNESVSSATIPDNLNSINKTQLAGYVDYTYQSKISLSSENNWQNSWTDLPVSGEVNGTIKYYYYFVEETTLADGYTVSYTNNNGIKTGPITITNTKTDTPSYELPETGGPGTRWYTLGGIFLAAAAGLLLCIKNFRGKEDC